VGTIALDGTKIKANASRHKAMSYDRMKEEEKRLKEEISRLMAEADPTEANNSRAASACLNIPSFTAALRLAEKCQALGHGSERLYPERG